MDRGGWRRALFAALVVIGAVSVGSSDAVAVGRAAAVSRGVLVNLDSSTGAEVWRAVPSHGGLYTSASLGEELVVASDGPCSDDPSSGELAAFDARTGRRQWTANGGGIATKTLSWSASSVVDPAADGVVVVGGGRGGNGVYGLDARSGEVRWTAPADSGELGVSSTLVFSSQAMSDGHLVLNAFERGTGSRRWTFPATPEPAWGNVFDVVAADTRTVVVANGNYLVRLGGRPAGVTTFFVLDAKTGTERARFTGDDPSFQSSDFVMNDGRLIYADGRSVVARDLTDGAMRWQHGFEGNSGFPGGSGFAVRATSGNQRVLVQLDDAVVALDVRSGAQRWVAKNAVTVASDARTTVLRLAGRQLVRGVRTHNGERQWQRRTPNGIATRFDTLSAGVEGARLAMSTVCNTD